MTYLLAGQAFELERLRLQARVFEPAGERLLAGIARTPGGARALDVGCGAMGWLRILDAWVGEQGTVVGSDIDDKMLDAARAFVDENKLSHVVLSKDDLFASALPASSFDLVHARFQIAPLGRGPEQVRAFVRLTKPGGLIVLEEPDTRSWHVSPRAPAVDELIALILRAFRVGGGDFDAGRALPNLLADAGLTAEVYEQVVTLEAGHQYLRLPIQFATSLRPRILTLIDETTFNDLVARAEMELARSESHGTTFTLVQAWAVRAFPLPE